MAVYQFSTLSDGQAISFDPNADSLNFDQTAISAADVRATAEGTSIRISASGKEVFLLASQLAQLTTTNVTFANGSLLLFGDNTTAQTADNSGNSLTGSSGNDHLWGFGGNDSLNGGSGNDWLAGGTGQDNITGGTGADSIVFREAASNNNFDRISGFVSGEDRLMFHEDVFGDITLPGRIIYNSSTGYLYFDADGSGAGRAQLVAILQGAPTLAAGDIGTFDDETTGGVGGEGATEGDDTLVGTAGDDSIDGLGGNDLIQALGGNDTLVGSAGDDTLDGGAGDDTYVMTAGSDTVVDPDGIDTIITNDRFFSLPDGIENLVLRDPSLPSGIDDGTLNGNELDNVITDETTRFVWINGGAGDDTLLGGVGGEMFTFSGPEDYGNDSVDGGADLDRIWVGNDSAVVVDFRAGTVAGGGAGGSGSVRFTNIEGVISEHFDDLLIADDLGRRLDAGPGDDTLVGGAGADALAGEGGWESAYGSGLGDDLIYGGGGDDILLGHSGADTLHGGAGHDFIRLDDEYTPGADTVVFDEAPDTSSADAIRGFTSSSDKLAFSNETHEGLGAAGDFAPGDARFFAGAGANSGQDASDRVVYNTSTGQLWYDADGSGSGAAELIATLEGAPTLLATDIVVIGEGGGGGGETIDGTAGNDSLLGGPGNDTMRGLAGRDALNGVAGDDWLEGGTGIDSITGGAGEDSFVYREAPTNSNFDRLVDFTSGTDTLRFDDAVYTQLGTPGDFGAGDDRFHAAAGAKAGVDAEDRLIYDTSNGYLWYDADGSGAGGQQLVGVVQGAPALTATDIAII